METGSVQISQNALEGIDTKIVVAMIAAIASGLIGVISVVANYIMHRQNIKQKWREERRKESLKQLNEFYIPLHNLLGKSKQCYDLFFKEKPGDFRTLTYLLDPDQEYTLAAGVKGKVILSESDKTLLNLIFEIGQSIEKLIDEKGGLVDDKELIHDFGGVNSQEKGMLDLLSAHLSIIRLANAGKLKGEVDKYKDYVYPRGTNERIVDKIKSIQAQLKTLESK